ncbi:MAG: peptidoglycan editing factor PgeF [Rhizobiales bacterium]|nr:peptidoglycan editing factor PgeF [Hyphomicrobiales bacterium]
MIESTNLKLPGVAHGFFTREGGHSSGLYASLNCGLGSGDDIAAVSKNRGIVSAILGVGADHLLTVHQHHSADVQVVTAPWPQAERPKADAMVTRERGIALGVLTADCGPVLFADPKAGVIGAAHAGWKGALGGVTDQTIAAMENLGASRGDLIAAVGPTISKEAYEVGPEFPARFLGASKENGAFFHPSARAGHAMFDLPGYLAARLALAGVGAVVNLDICTFAGEARFFSYRRATHRRETDYGRQISAIALM